MDRRHFLRTAIGAATLLRVPSARSQSEVVKRGAVVIGVDKPGTLEPLHAAKSGARSVAAWLQAEGFHVELFVDDPSPVTVSNVFAAIDRFVHAGTLDQLVIYFGGHGFISGTLSEFWMLSGAPDNPNEAVSLTESSKYAEESGIPNVVFISDACRSTADSLTMQGLHGGVLFPRTTNPPRVSDVDQFLAARIGASAYEVAPANNPSAAQGIFTSCFLEAYRNPYPSMVETVANRPVVPNRRLRKYLAAEVPKKAQSMSVTYNQVPDSKVLSDEPTYIAHVSGTARTPQPNDTVSLADVAAIDIEKSYTSYLMDPESSASYSLRASSGYDRAKDVIVQARGLALELPARSGFTISGRHLARVTARPGIATRFTNSSGKNTPSSLVEVDLTSHPAASVALRFSDGSGTVLAALRNYVGNVVTGGSGVSDVSYVPSRTSPMRSAYESEAGHVEELRVSVATAAQFGVFRFEGGRAQRTRAAAEMGDRIRVLKGIDPTLGLYAAYAYDEANLIDKVKSVRQYMHSTLEVDLYDVALLSGELPATSMGVWRWTTPFCPMLSQGWGLLRVKDARLPEPVSAARDYLFVSLWNTLAPGGMNVVEDALQRQLVG